MSSLSHYDGWTVDEIVARNSHELTATQILAARQYILEQRQSHAEELAALRQHIDDVHRIGHRVTLAAQKGRKTVRIDEVTA